MMKPQEQIKRAQELCLRIRSASAEVVWRGRPVQIRSADPNELKKIYTFLVKHRDLNKLRRLVEKLPSSNFAKRSGSTEGYYKNIQSALGPEFYRLGIDDAIFIMGWACRLLEPPSPR